MRGLEMHLLRRLSFTLLIFLGLTLSLGAIDIVTLDGVTYRNCEVTAVEPDALVFRYKDGSARVVYDNLPPAMKTKYFDPEKVEAYRKEQTEKREAEQRARDEAVAKEKRKQKEFVDETRRLEQEDRNERVQAQEEFREMETRPANVRYAALGVAVIVGICLIVWFAFNKPGPVLVLIGVMTAIYFWNFYDTTVAEPPREEGKEARVESPVLVQRRQAGAIIGGVLFVAGVLVAAMDGKGKRAPGVDE
jgi:hypothetical protein